MKTEIKSPGCATLIVLFALWPITLPLLLGVLFALFAEGWPKQDK